MYELIRCDAGTHTPGILIVNGQLFNLEGLPWKNNQRNTSCVEDGIYNFFKDKSPNKGRQVIELRPKNGRSQVQFHVGELHQLKGCFGHETRAMEEDCFNALPDAGQIRITTIEKPLIQEK